MKKFIYGAGKYGKLLLQYMKNLNENIECFVQTEEIGGAIEGVPVISCKRMLALEGKKVVFIAISNKKIAKEIEQNIYNADNCNIRVYNYSNFIEDNLLLSGNKIQLHGEKHCIVCKNNPSEFLPGGIEEEIFKQHHIIGGGSRENCICPCCGSGDRERWLYYVLKNKLNMFETSGRVLHFAPEKEVSNVLKENVEIDYYTCDIVPGRAMHVADITDIQFKENSFDYVICNHVMEHIVNEKKAVFEIKRVLKPNGKWIFSFPICTDMKTYEDDTILLPEDRLKAYGQEDHVRLYGYDYKERFENYGLQLQIFSPEKEMNEEDISKYGFIKDDVIVVATKCIS